MKQYISSHIFNFRLFLEGLKRLKVSTFALGILSVTLSALTPTISWISALERQDAYIQSNISMQTTTISYGELCLPIYLVVFLAPFFILSIFSYLHKRRQADFFHAIPYTRTCTYVSFATSALASVMGIMLASCLAAGILWSLNPYCEFILMDLIVQFGVCLLSAVFLMSIMTLAVTLTGTSGMSVALFALFCLLWRYILYLFSETLFYFVLPKEHMIYLAWDWFLPFRLFTDLDYGYCSYADRYPFAQIVYTIILTLVLFILAGFFYKKRKSEMAGTMAPNRLTQHIFRCLFCLPAAMLMPYFLLNGERDIAFHFTIIVVTLLIYYLYEIITTKRFRGIFKTTKGLVGVVAAILLFVGSYYALKGVILYEKIEPDEIASITLLDDSTPLLDPYQSYLLEDTDLTNCDDLAVIQAVADALCESQVSTRTQNYKSYIIYEDYYRTVSDRREVSTKIKLKSGRVIIRNVLYHDADLQRMLYAYVMDIAGIDITELPITDTMIDVRVSHGAKNERSFVLKQEDVALFTETFLKEYNTLSPEERMIYRSPLNSRRDYYMTYWNYTYVNIQMNLGEYEGNDSIHDYDYNIYIYIQKDVFPETYEMLEDCRNAQIQDGGDQ